MIASALFTREGSAVRIPFDIRRICKHAFGSAQWLVCRAVSGCSPASASFAVISAPPSHGGTARPTRASFGQYTFAARMRHLIYVEQKE